MKTEDGVKYITQIDDYKRELLMRVRDRIENPEKFEEQYGTRFICYKIKNVLYEENFTDVFKNLFSQDPINELFPEFTDMFDGFCWYEDGKNCEVGVNRWWWEPSWKEPRIRILDTLLRD